MGAYLLTIDLGTSGPKVALISPKLEVIAFTTRSQPLIFLPNGGVEQDAETWWQLTVNAIQSLWEKNPTLKEQVVGIIVTSQWSTLVAVDREAKPLHNAISWMDTRGAVYIAKLFRGLIEYHGYDVLKLGQWLWITGGVPGNSGKDTLAHILYLKAEKNEVYQKAFKLLEAKDYLNARLTGCFGATPDSLILYWLTDNRDPFRVQYHEDLLAITGIDKEKLPQIYPQASVLGELSAKSAGELGLKAGIPVLVGCPDMQASAIGSGGVLPYDPHLYLGTSSWISCHVKERKVSTESNMATIPSAIPGYYLIGNEQECAGYCVSFFIENFLAPWQKENPFHYFEELAQKAPVGSKNLIFTPWLSGERTPVENKHIRGGFHNLGANHELPDMARAILEGVSFNTRWLLEHVEKFALRSFAKIRFIGGGAQNKLWCQIMADVLEREIIVPENPRFSTLRGAAAIGFYSLGYFDIYEMADLLSSGVTYYPKKENVKVYEKLYRSFRELYVAHNEIFAKVNS